MGAKVMLTGLLYLSTIEERRNVSIECEARDVPELFVEMLNEILFKQGVEELALARLRIDEIKRQENGRYKLKGIAFGEPVDIDKHAVKTEVKAATYAGLKYENKEGKHILQCVVDV